MGLNAYLSFNGQCQEAFKVYESCLKGKITYQGKYGEAPGHENMPPEWRDRIMHVTLQVGDDVLQGADAPPGAYQKPQGFSVALQLKDAAEADHIFKTLEQGATVQMPLQETFWAARFGMLVDRFGTPWAINCEKAT